VQTGVEVPVKWGLHFGDFQKAQAPTPDFPKADIAMPAVKAEKFSGALRVTRPPGRDSHTRCYT
jgi:hypothetical protein